jgi:hypothetical protein
MNNTVQDVIDKCFVKDIQCSSLFTDYRPNYSCCSITIDGEEVLALSIHKNGNIFLGTRKRGMFMVDENKFLTIGIKSYGIKDDPETEE